jgi:periplasmic protein TonB
MTTQAPEPASYPDLSDADLLNKVKPARSGQRLVAPAGDNAIEYYLAIRRRNANDENAKSALIDLFPYAMIATEQNLKKGDEPGRAEAARIFSLLEHIDANAPALPRLRAMMQQQVQPSSKAGNVDLRSTHPQCLRWAGKRRESRKARWEETTCASRRSTATHPCPCPTPQQGGSNLSLTISREKNGS